MRPAYERKNTFKTRGLDADELRKRREEASFTLRRDERISSLMKRRQLQPGDFTDDMENTPQQMVRRFLLS